MNFRDALGRAAGTRPISLAAAALIGLALPSADTRQIFGVLGLSISGCAAVVGPNICELPENIERKLAIWIPSVRASAGEIRVISDAVSGSRYQAQQMPSGLRLSVPLRLEKERALLELRVAGQPVLELVLRRAIAYSWERRVERASSRETLALLERRMVHATAAERSKLARAIGESELALGDTERAFSVLREGARMARKERRYSEARSHWLRSAYHRASAHEFEAAEQALANARTVPQLAGVMDADGEAAIAYVTASYAARVRDLRAAQQAYEQAQSWVERGAALMAPQIAVGRAHVAEQQGRREAAIALLKDASNSDLARAWPCFRALATARIGWYGLANCSGEEACPLRARDLLDRASALYETECTKAPQEEPMLAELYGGFAALALRDVPRARAKLERAQRFEASPRARLWSRLLEAEVLSAERRFDESERQFSRVDSDAQRLLSWDLVSRAREGAAHVLSAQSRFDAAVTAFERAESALDESMAWIPADDGVLEFLNSHSGAAEGLASTLLRLGREPEAFAALRRARRRAIAGLARAEPPRASVPWRSAMVAYLTERERIERAAQRLETCPASERAVWEDELARSKARARNATDSLLRLAGRGSTRYAETALRAPKQDEALLLWSKIAGSWHGFLELNGQVHHVSVIGTPEGRAWLEPFAPWLAGARTLTVLPKGPLSAFDVQTLGLEGNAPLRVAYALDLPERSRAGRHDGHDLLAGDAFGDLLQARRELQSIDELLTSAGARVQKLIGPALSASEFLRAMAQARRLHYAGHAEFLGAEGWQSQLAMSRSALTAADILSSPSVPEEVVLSACEAAREPGLIHAAGLGLAQAFLLAGSRAVVAPSRVISDRAARSFSLALWRQLAAGRTLESAYEATLSALGPEDEARAFRLLLP